MIRKSLAATLVAVMLVVMVTAAAFAQGYGPGVGAGTPGTGQCLAGGDLDGDGVCDNWIDGDGDGVNDNAALDGTGNQFGRRGQRQNAAGSQRANAPRLNQSSAFVDADGDGVCDLFTDADGDGVNDAAPRNGTGNQYGRRGR